MSKLFTIIIFFLLSPVFAGDLYDIEKTNEIKNINETLGRAKRRIKVSPGLQGSDFLKLLPSLSIGQSGSTNDFSTNELRFSASINMNQIFDIADRSRNNDAIKRKALQKIREEGFVLKKLSERKYLLKKQIWKFSTIRNSTDNPVEHANLDEKIDNLTVKLQETEIEMEKRMTEIEFMCIEAER